MKNRLPALLIGIIAILLVFTVPVRAADTDEILNYKITVTPNSDATLSIFYDIEWLVLDSDSLGPLEWVKVGIPNKHTISYEATTDTVSRISTMSSGGYYMRIDLDKKYYEGEVVKFGFKIVQDNMYQVDKLEEGYSVYSFTPGWFDDIKVDKLTIFWDMDNVESWTPECEIVDGLLVFKTSLGKGDKYTVSVTYPNDAYAFDLSKSDEGSSGSGLSSVEDFFTSLIAFVLLIAFFGGFFILPIFIIVKVIQCAADYAKGGNLGNTQKKITRTKVTYFPSCQGCGAVRKEGEQFCTYCGRSFVQSEEVIKEENIKAEDKGILDFKRDGEYRYSSSPNTYIRVHSVVVPVVRPTYTSTRSSSSRSSSHHSSCAHSSCACACACACAGGGRAGCTYKDFYNTDLKLRQLELKLKR